MSSSCRDPPALALVKSIFSRSMRASSLLADQPSFIPPSSEYKKSQAALLSWPINLHFNRSPFRCCDCHLFPINRRASSSNCFKVLTSSHIASTAFTWGTVFVVPFYTLMILAPKAALAKRVMESNIPYVALGLMYGCLLHLSWTPATLHTIFATKYLLPELPGMTKMFSNEMTMASAWIHLLAVDLYAARQVYHDGLENNVETRHSVTFCLFFCPIGILSHVITKMLSKPSSISKEGPPPINEIGK